MSLEKFVDRLKHNRLELANLVDTDEGDNHFERIAHLSVAIWYLEESISKNGLYEAGKHLQQCKEEDYDYYYDFMRTLESVVTNCELD